MATRNERWGIKVGDSVRLRAYGDEEIVRVVVGITDSGRLVIANPAELEVARREGRKPAPPLAWPNDDVLGRAVDDH